MPIGLFFSFRKTFMVLVSLFVFLFGGVIHRVESQSITLRYVAVDGYDSGSCDSPQLPCRSIQYAVNRSNSGDTILVSEGVFTYKKDFDVCSFLQTRAVICFVDKRLTILGGYKLNNWNVAYPNENPTIIDGSNFYRGVAVIGYNSTISHLEMSGFIIQNSKAQGPTYLSPYDPSGVGGGMLVQHASVILRDVVFKNNQAIGADVNVGAGGQADGAGLRIEEPPPGTSSLLQRVVFDNNVSIGGAGPERGGIAFGSLYIYKANVTIEDSQFRNNVARAGNSAGSGLFFGLRADALGGGIAVQEGNITIRNVQVVNNQVIGGSGRDYGGGGYGGGIFIEDFGSRNTYVSISDSYIAENRASGGSGAIGGNGAGGGIDVDSSKITIDRTKIILNSVIGGNGNTSAGPGAGGGVYIFTVREGNFKAVLNNVIIANNYADQGFGKTSIGNGGGGGIVVHGIVADIVHTTIANNHIGDSLVLGHGLLVQPWPDPNNSQYPAVVNFVNGVIANHDNPQGAAVVVQKSSELSFQGGLFSGNTRNTNKDGQPVSSGTINGLSSMAIASSIGFVAPQEPYYNFHLRVDSLAKDRSTNIAVSYDYDDQNRPYENLSDYGADEYHPLLVSYAPGNGQIYLDWSDNIKYLFGGAHHYGVVIDCETNVDSPKEGQCGEEINTQHTSITLTGLTNFKYYIIVINACNSSGELIAESTEIKVFPTNIFSFLPMVMR